MLDGDALVLEMEKVRNELKSEIKREEMGARQWVDDLKDLVNDVKDTKVFTVAHIDAELLE